MFSSSYSSKAIYWWKAFTGRYNRAASYSKSSITHDDRQYFCDSFQQRLLIFFAHLMTFLLNFRGFASTVHSWVSCRVIPDHTVLCLEKTETHFWVSRVHGIAFLLPSLGKESELFSLPWWKGQSPSSAVESAKHWMGFCGLFQHCWYS